MFQLLVLTLVLSTTFTDAAPDIGAIINGLNQKATDLLKNVALPVFNEQVDRVKAHFASIMAFFKKKEGDIKIGTQFVVHFTAERCHLFGKRLILVDFQTCVARAEETQTGLKATCSKGSQTDAIQCATEEVINLLRLVAISLKNKG